MRKHELLIVLANIIALTFISGCAQIGQTGPGNASGSGQTNNSVSVTGTSSADLTNANSPQAAGFNGTGSITKLAQPSGSFNPVIGLKLVADGLAAPMVAVSPDDGTGRLFIVDQIGVIKILDANGTLLNQPFLDVSSKLVKLNPGYDERGLLGLAFHPNFTQNGRVFIYYSAPLRSGAPQGWSHTNYLSEFNVSQNGMADPGSEKVIMAVDKPQSNHNGGQIRFGPDGYLYIPTGDGGRADDTGLGHTPGIGNAQDLTKPLGKILRIDVDHPSNGKPYGIPSDNPFIGNSSRVPEIYAYGLRNPAYASFDSQSGDLFVATAGQELFECVYIIVKGGDYGWNIREGTHCFDPNNPTQPPSSCRTTGYNGEPLIGPIVELGHDVGSTVVGGHVYRGRALPDFQGRYIFSDWGSPLSLANGLLMVASPPSGWSWTMPSSAGNLTPSQTQMWITEGIRVANAPGLANANVRGFGEDSDREVYVLLSEMGGPTGTTGKVYKIVPASNVTSGA
ncbi:MAG TPA: PQQ-dependent sugar dehydrogenase [Methanotrichaceae archaeon]|nr:PQQ-dependent sugar dehydrogenase [Methanotrichaceae archaeon]